MLDRQDIDALLVGALYGELSSSDQERLTTHLEAHPADRNALDDLKSAQQVIRTKVASSRIFELQLEPPQAISAQLLQEAAHRAPKVRAAASDAPAREGWFARFVQSFVRHPAMAAAATLVLVVGVAGSIYLRTGEKGMVEPTVGQLAAPSAATDQSNLQNQAGSGVDGVAVALAEDKQQETQTVTGADRGAMGGASATEKGTAAPVATKAVAPTAMPKPEPAPHLAKPASKAAYVQSDNRELQPRDLDEAKVAKNDDYKKSGERTSARSDRSDPVADVPSATGAGSLPLAPGAAMGQASSTIAASPPPPPVQVPAPVAKAPDSNFAWAKDQHARVAALVKAGNCQEAAPLAVAIKSRDPEYYNSFVATDRALKPCMQYMIEAADREAEKKPAKMRVNTDAK